MIKYHCDNCGHIQSDRLPRLSMLLNGLYNPSVFSGKDIELCSLCVAAASDGALSALDKAKTSNVIHRAAGKTK